MYEARGGQLRPVRVRHELLRRTRDGQEQVGLILGISSAGGVCTSPTACAPARLRLTRCITTWSRELREHGDVSMALYPQAGITENANFPGGDTPSYAGRAVAALMNASEEDMTTLTGKVIQTREVADKFGFTDVGEKHPGRSVHQPRGDR